MDIRSLILGLALPLLPSGTWNGEHPIAEACERTTGNGDENALAREILAHDYGVREADLTRLCKGRIITGTLPTPDARQMTLIGIVKLSATAGQFTRYAEEVGRLVATEHVTALGSIDVSNLQTALQSYPILADDVREVPSCEVGDCDVKLPRNVILEMAHLDPSSSRFETEVAATIRQWLRQYLSSYDTEGNTALVVYADKDPPQPLHDGFNGLIADAQVLADRVPALYDYFNGTVDQPPNGAREGVIWSVERFGMRPLTTVTHGIVYRDSVAGHAEAWVAMKLLYASHYLHASLRLMRVVEDPASAEPAAYLVCIDRLLFDGKVRGVVRALVKRRLRSHLADRMRDIRDSVSEYGLMMADRSEDR
ncbi:MAG: hypothetical protein JSW71_07105 [Gemmatimonadota bacterium]|nr:MAG: hypothetical protein JSW71_07105 [Gemmatimonadota bacterium]